tara:strand:- start:255 stop:407 length:153 start_codon:yes stop_codon:yes gene_type:complete
LDENIIKTTPRRVYPETFYRILRFAQNNKRRRTLPLLVRERTRGGFVKKE